MGMALGGCLAAVTKEMKWNEKMKKWNVMERKGWCSGGGGNLQADHISRPNFNPSTASQPQTSHSIHPIYGYKYISSIITPFYSAK